jgi:hypothetical protein
VVSVHDPVRGAAFGELRQFRQEFYACLTSRADAVFELDDAVLCADGPVRSLAELSLVAEHRRGHGSAYAAVVDGRIDVERLRTALARVSLPRAADGRLVLAVDITCWLRPEAQTSTERILCHTRGRGKGQAIMIPGWPYSMIAALEPGRSSWTAPLDFQRLAPGDDAASVTAAQLRHLLDRLMTAGQWRQGDPDILIIADAGYDGPRLAPFNRPGFDVIFLFRHVINGSLVLAFRSPPNAITSRLLLNAHHDGLQPTQLEVV